MKYVVVKADPGMYEELYAFPDTRLHREMVEILKAEFPGLEVVSAGHLTNHRDTFTLKDGGEEAFDQVRLLGLSETLRVESRPQDTDLFRRLAQV